MQQYVARPCRQDGCKVLTEAYNEADLIVKEMYRIKEMNHNWRVTGRRCIRASKRMTYRKQLKRAKD
jgi:hypothetical protein